MPHSTPSDNLQFEHIELDDKTLAAMARLVMCFAEIEDALTLSIMRTLKLDEHEVHTLTGPVGLSKRIKIAQQAAALKDAHIAATIKATFQGETWHIAKQMRDCVSHGLFLGTNTGEHLLFRVTDLDISTHDNPTFTVRSFSVAQFYSAANDAQSFVRRLREALGVQALHELRLKADLVPRQKGRRKSSPQKAHPKPPPPSQA